MTRTDSKPIFIHFVCVCLFVLSGLAGTVAFLYHRDFTQQSTDLQQAVQEVSRLQTAKHRADEQLRDLKVLLDYGQEEVGSLDNPAKNTLIGAALDHMRSRTGNLTKETLRVAMDQLAHTRNQLTVERDSLREDKTSLQAEYTSLNDRFMTDLQVQNEARQRAEALLQDRITSHEEAIKDKTQQITQLDEILRRQRIEIADAQAQLDAAGKRWRDRERQYQATIRRFKRLVAVRDSDQFEIPDGEVVWVNHDTGLVWISLGSRDKLSTRLTFGVYPKEHGGFGPAKKNAKGSIQVTRVVSADLAEARITRDELINPIARGDVVYSPLWSPGRTESIAFAGLIDLDGDGQADHDALRTLVETAGAKVHTIVDEHGNRLGRPLDLDVKFLVIGQMPEIEDAKTPQDREVFRKMIDHASMMQREAAEYPTVSISVNDFKSYIGYRPRVRTTRPGLTAPKEHDVTVRDRTKQSTGRTSRLYQSKRPSKSDSSGRRSGRFGIN